jgi:nitrogen fixation protein
VWVEYRLDRAAVAEDDEWGVNVTLTAAQALRLAELLRDTPPPAGSLHDPAQ